MTIKYNRLTLCVCVCVCVCGGSPLESNHSFLDRPKESINAKIGFT
jgi:hypothetical protein